MNIAIMGIRGIPANYGGFETFAEELAPRLVHRGHKVTVYGRSNIINYKDKFYKGVEIKILPTIRHKYLDTVFHTFLCILHSLFMKFDVILICNASNSIFAFIPRLTGKKVVVNVDGIERKRKKWSWVGKLWYLFGEMFSVILPNKIVTDAKVIHDYYEQKYKKKSVFIPYGANLEKADTINILNKFGLRPNEYFLYVSRLEPENNAHIVMKAFEKVETTKKLVIVGDAVYADRYIQSLKKTRDSRVIFTGFVFGDGYREFQSHAYCYIHATEVGGTHPALIEAMAVGNCVIANGTPENTEVLGNTGLLYSINNIDDLRKKLKQVLDDSKIIIQLGQKAADRVRTYYTWDIVTDEYEKLFHELV